VHRIPAIRRTAARDAAGAAAVPVAAAGAVAVMVDAAAGAAVVHVREDAAHAGLARGAAVVAVAGPLLTCPMAVEERRRRSDRDPLEPLEGSADRRH
jgi:hypothetical protein